MEKKLKKVQRAASVGFVLLKILRILLIVTVVLLIVGLVALAVVNENDLKMAAVQDGKLVIDMQTLDLSQLGLDSVPNIGQLVQNGILTLELKDAKLVVMLLVAAGIIVLAGTYFLLLVAGNLFKHVKAEDTPFTAGNVRRLRLLGILHIAFWACGLVLSYFVGFEFIRRLGLPSSSVTVSLNLTALLVSLIYFFLARVFSFGKVQGDVLAEHTAEPVYSPIYPPVQETESEPKPAPAPVYQPEPQPVYQAPAAPAEPLYTEPLEAPEPAPEAAPVEAAEAVKPEE